LNGLGVPISFTKAKGHFETAAQARSVHGIYNMGAMYMTPPPPMTKAEQESAAAGNNNNNNNKEVLFDFDFKKAVAHFKVAAKAGHIHAMHKLGHMTVHGIGVEDEQSSSGSGGGGGGVHTFPHCEEAVGLFKKVSERGPTSALITEAEDYHMAGNTFASLWHYTKAADLGYEVAQANAAYMYEQLTTVELEHLGVRARMFDRYLKTVESSRLKANTSPLFFDF
jgi:SEL1 protein